jgi:hypothetical protein
MTRGHIRAPSNTPKPFQASWVSGAYPWNDTSRAAAFVAGGRALDVVDTYLGRAAWGIRLLGVAYPVEDGVNMLA